MDNLDIERLLCALDEEGEHNKRGQAWGAVERWAWRHGARTIFDIAKRQRIRAENEDNSRRLQDAISIILEPISGLDVGGNADVRRLWVWTGLAGFRGTRSISHLASIHGDSQNHRLWFCHALCGRGLCDAKSTPQKPCRNCVRELEKHGHPPAAIKAMDALTRPDNDHENQETWMRHVEKLAADVVKEAIGLAAVEAAKEGGAWAGGASKNQNEI